METGLGKPKGAAAPVCAQGLQEPGGKGSFMASEHPECSTGSTEGPSQLDKGDSAGTGPQHTQKVPQVG